MKKIFLSVLTIFLTASLYATDLNIYASGLNAHEVDDAIVVDYILNAQATSLIVRLSDGVNEPIEIPIAGGADDVNFGKGSHTNVPVNMAGVPAGTYTWEMVASAAANMVTSRVPASYSCTYTLPRGLDIDKDPQSPSFGQIYVVDAISTSEESGAVYYYPASLDSRGTFFTGGGSSWWAASGSSPFRATVGEDHLLYITDWTDAQPNVYVLDPQNPSSTTKSLIFGGTYQSEGGGIYLDASSNPIHGSIPHCYVKGSGASRVLYTFDEDMYGGTNKQGIFAYNINTLSSLWVAPPSTIVYDNANNYLRNGNSQIWPDGKGGWWISQHRATDSDAIPILVHVNSSGVANFHSGPSSIRMDGGASEGGYGRGAIGLNLDKTQMAVVRKGNIDVWNISWSGEVPTLVKAYTVSTGINDYTCFNVSFDYAGNIYVIYAGYNIYAYAPVKSTNSCVTPARTSNTIEWDGNVVNVTAVSLDPTEATLELQRTVTLVPTISPNNATNQNVSWESSNTSVATVSNTGVVTAVAEGSATITVTTEDGGFTATCAITVDPYEISVNTLYLDQTIAELSGKTIRRALVRGEHMFVLALDNSNNPYLYRINTHNGEVVDIPTDFCSVIDSRGLKLSDIALTSDGVLVGCNKEYCICNPAPANPFKIYKWTESPAGEFSGEVWSSNATASESGLFYYALTGETMAYIGSSTTGKVVASAVTTGSDSGAIRFSITNFSEGEYSSALANKSSGLAPLTTVYLGAIKLNVAPNGSSLVIDGTLNNPYKFDLVVNAANVSPSLFMSPSSTSAYTNYFSYDDRDLAVSTHFTASQNDGFELNEIVDGVTPAVEHDAPALSPVAATYAVALGATESGEAYFYVLRDDKLSAYTTANAYTRSGLTVDNFSTICLPYAVDADKVWGAEVYNVASANGSPLTSITLSQEDGGLVAGKPYVIKPTKNTFACIYTGDEQTTVQDANGLVGKLDETAESVPDGASSYIFKDGQLHFVPNGVTISFMKNRAYFNQSAYSGPVSAPGRKTLTIPAAPNNATGMDNVEQNEEVQKFFRDGKVYIRRGNTVYDALGRIINK